MGSEEFPRNITDYSRWAVFYKNHLVGDILPFYLNHALDEKYGGYTTCLDNDGTMLSGDKYLWSQGRGLLMFSILYEQLGREEKYLHAARLGAKFVTNHGRDENGEWVYHTDREGKTVLEGPISIYAGMFAAYGLTAYYRITKDPSALALAEKTLNTAYERFNTPGFNQIAPYHVKSGWRVHGPQMIFLNVAEEFCRTIDSPAMEKKIEHCVNTILEKHYKPQHGLILEHVTWDGNEINEPEGQIVNPGHNLECGWFLLHWAVRHRRKDIVSLVNRMVQKVLPLSWDPQYGGLFLAIDLKGNPHPTFANADTKPWWILSEALYALPLLHEITGETWMNEWFLKIFNWAMAHHRSPWGDWYQRLDRQGNAITKVIGLPVKDPFHLPRALLLGYQCFDRLAKGQTWKGNLDD
jgi:N-acylglucosamine 2-epimerase